MATISPHSMPHFQSGTGGGMPHGLGLLTTVASLPPKYRSRYLNIKTKCETPLDLSVKPMSPQIANDVPIATSFAEVYTEPSQMLAAPEGRHAAHSPFVDASQSETGTVVEPNCKINAQQQQQSCRAVVIVAAAPARPLTPLSPPSNKRRHLSEGEATEHERNNEADVNPPKLPKTEPHPTAKHEVTPMKSTRPCNTAPRTTKNCPPSAKPSRNKATRKLKFDEETSSPVSGTIIRPLEEITDSGVHYSNGDIDPEYNIVEVTEQTRAELAAIKNVIGDYVCKLCRIKFEDAFGLARHRCACIVLLEYRCPECGKQFNCPANLASHRRWHKPKKEAAAPSNHKKENRNVASTAVKQAKVSLGDDKKTAEEAVFSCGECGRTFKRQAYLRKHRLTHANRKAAPRENVEPIGLVAPRQPSHHSYAGSATSSASSMHSYNAAQEDEGVYTVTSGFEFEGDTMSECSSSSAGYGRLQIVEGGLTEEENIAAAALTNLRNCASVIQHTTLAH